MSITQTEFDYLMALQKVFDDELMPLELGPPPIQWTRELSAANSHEKFLLDFRRGSLGFGKYTLNKRYRQSVILLRYDNSGRHTNPDGTRFDGPHVHIFHEGYNDKFAFPVTDIGVSPSDPIQIVLDRFLEVCNVIKVPTIIATLY